jgi:hypothetical protein
VWPDRPSLALPTGKSLETGEGNLFYYPNALSP